MRSIDRWRSSLEKTKQEKEEIRERKRARREVVRKERQRTYNNMRYKVIYREKKIAKLEDAIVSGKHPKRLRKKRKQVDGVGKEVDTKSDQTPGIAPGESQTQGARKGQRETLRGRPRGPRQGWGHYDPEASNPRPYVEEDAEETAAKGLAPYGERGISTYTTTDGLPVMFLHYSACSRKDPETKRGSEWLELESRAYPGGIDGPRWLQEMEIRFDVRDTSRVFPEWEEMQVWATCRDFDIRQYEHWPIIVGYDYGYQEPTAIVVLALASEEEIYQIDEIYVKETSIGDQAALLKMKPYFSRISEFYGDPAIWARTQHQGTITTSMGQIWEDEYDITYQRGQNFVGSDAAFINLLQSVLWERGNCRFKIFESCKNTIKEIRTLAWAEAKVENPNVATRETIANKNVHAFDALKYALLERYRGKGIATLPAPPGSVDYWIEEMTRAQESVRYVLAP